MCVYPSRTHSVCLACRVSYKHPIAHGPNHCLRCHAELIDAGPHLEVPRRVDQAGWRALAAVLDSGLDFHGGCCGTGPGYRPRTPAAVRQRLLLADRTGMSIAEALATADPTVVAAHEHSI
ncbi:hypothetical protein ACWDYH_21135 [Nocardia goodfellowii]